MMSCDTFPTNTHENPFAQLDNSLAVMQDLIDGRTGTAQLAHLLLTSEGLLKDKKDSSPTEKYSHVLLDVQDADGHPSGVTWILTISSSETGRTQTEITHAGGKARAIQYDLGVQNQLIGYRVLSEEETQSAAGFALDILRRPTTDDDPRTELRASQGQELAKIGMRFMADEASYGAQLPSTMYLPGSKISSLRDEVPKVGPVSYADSLVKAPPN